MKPPAIPDKSTENHDKLVDLMMLTDQVVPVILCNNYVN